LEPTLVYKFGLVYSYFDTGFYTLCEETCLVICAFTGWFTCCFTGFFKGYFTGFYNGLFYF